MTELRQWQRRALDEYLASGISDFLVEATPGAGKTIFSAALAQRLLDDGTAERVAVVVPTDALRLQWCDKTAGLLRLRPLDDEIVFKPGYDGVVATYQQLARGASSDLLRRAIGQHRTLGIFDEIHHVGDGRSWSVGLRNAFDAAERRVCLTGTPWRRDNKAIPYVRYDDQDNLVVDYHYRYPAAVNDQVCRPIVFHAHTGEARWVDCGEVVEAHVSEHLDEEKVGAALDVLYDPGQKWMPAMLRKAAAALDELRTEVPDAAGLVWAEDKRLADTYATLLAAITGEMPTVIHSGDSEQDTRDAKLQIEKFERGRGKWMVSVRMVSEGVDIPRLSVGVFAAKKYTPLFFRQAVGRLVRMRPDDNHNAQMFIPAVPQIVKHAYEIEQELRHQLHEEEERAQREQKAAEDYQQTLNFRVPLSASEPVLTEAIHRGYGVAPELLAEAEAKCERYGFPLEKAASIALLLQEERNRTVEVSGQITVQPAPQAEAQHRLEKRLRDEVEALGRRIDYKEDRAPGSTNAELLRAGFPKRKLATIAQLQEMRAWLAGRLG